ncbi:MAG: hypothetical protein U1E65_10495 [Myxococcota bacterium]
MDPLWAVIFLLSGIFVGGVAAFVYLQRAYLEEFRSMAERLDRFERSMRPSIAPVRTEKVMADAKMPDTRTDARSPEPRVDTAPDDQGRSTPVDPWPQTLRGRDPPLIAPPIPGLTPAEGSADSLEARPLHDGSAETLPPVLQPASVAVMPAPMPVAPPLVAAAPRASARLPALANARTPTLTDQPTTGRALSALVEKGSDASDPASEQGLVSLPLSALKPIASESIIRKADPTMPMALGEPPLPTAVAQAIQQRALRADDEVTQLDPALEPDMIAHLQAPRLSDEVIEPPLPSESSGSRRVFDEPSLPRVGPAGELLRGTQARTRVPDIEENADPQWVWNPGPDLAAASQDLVNPDDQSSTTRMGHSLAPTDSLRRDPSGRKS